MQDDHAKQLLEFIQSNLIKNKRLEISQETLLFGEKILDSMSILDLMGYIEEKLGRKLDDSEIVMTNFQSVNTIINAFFHKK